LRERQRDRAGEVNLEDLQAENRSMARRFLISLSLSPILFFCLCVRVPGQDVNAAKAEQIVDRLFQDINKRPTESISLHEFMSSVGSSEALSAFFPF
jgi:hypothetical protein